MASAAELGENLEMEKSEKIWNLSSEIYLVTRYWVVLLNSATVPVGLKKSA